MKQYIKFNPNSQVSLDMAVSYAEKLGYKKLYWDGFQKTSIHTWILCVCNEWIYISACGEEEIINMWWEELKMEDVQWVYVSDKSEERALSDRDKRILVSKVGVTNICVEPLDNQEYIDWEFFGVCTWRYAVPVEKEKKERKLLLTDCEWEKVQNILNIK